MRLGERFSVRVAEGSGGALLGPVLQPEGRAVQIVRRFHDKAVYEARHLGAVKLVAHNTYHCARATLPRDSCVAFVVHVVAKH